jgi:hypothetical protein
MRTHAQPEDIEDEGDLAVAEDGRPGVDLQALEHLVERLDHDLLGIVDRIDDQAEAPFVGLQHDEVLCGASLAGAGVRPSSWLRKTIGSS